MSSECGDNKAKARCEQLKRLEMQHIPLLRCPENKTQPIIFESNMKPNYPATPIPLTTESHEKYVTPQRKKRTVTREVLLENFWWHEFYEEYLRELYSEIDIPKIPNSEYVDIFGKEPPIKPNIEEIIDRYPIYASNAITCYNQSGDKTQNFRKKYSVTRPVSEQYDTQFG